MRGLSARRGLTHSLYESISGASVNGERPDSERLKMIADEFMTGRSALLSASSFYDFLQPDCSGKKVFVCDGTACLASGRAREVRQSLRGEYSDDEIGTMTCLGHCHSNNAFLVNGEIRLAGNEARPPAMRVASNAEIPALLTPTGDVREYFSLTGKWIGRTEAALKELEVSGLRGRGGAGFPFHVKVRSSREAAADKKYVVCNGDEGDPGAFSDKWLLEERPHAVLFGMLLTGVITGTDTGVAYIRGEYPLAVRRVREAVRQLETAGMATGADDDHLTRFRFHVVEGSGAYICGEETSLLNSVAGGHR